MYTFLCVRDSPVGWSTKGVVKRNCSSGVCCRSSYLTNFAVLTNIAGAQHVRWVMLMLALLSVPPPIPPNCPTHLYSCPPHLSPSPVPPLAPPLPSPPVPSCHPTCPPVPPSPLLHVPSQTEFGLRVLSYIGYGLSIICLFISIFR